MLLLAMMSHPISSNYNEDISPNLYFLLQNSFHSFAGSRKDAGPYLLSFSSEE